MGREVKSERKVESIWHREVARRKGKRHGPEKVRYRITLGRKGLGPSTKWSSRRNSSIGWGKWDAYTEVFHGD